MQRTSAITAVLAVALMTCSCAVASAAAQLDLGTTCMVSMGQGEGGLNDLPPEYTLRGTGLPAMTMLRVSDKQSDDSQTEGYEVDVTTDAAGAFSRQITAREDVASKAATMHIEVATQTSNAALAALDVRVVPRQVFPQAPSYITRFRVGRTLGYRFEGFPGKPIYAHLAYTGQGRWDHFHYLRTVLLGHGIGPCGKLTVHSRTLARILSKSARDWRLQFDTRRTNNPHGHQRLFDCVAVTPPLARDQGSNACSVEGA